MARRAVWAIQARERRHCRRCNFRRAGGGRIWRACYLTRRADEPVPALGDIELQLVVLARSRVIVRQPAAERAHGHSHQRLLRTIEGGVAAEDVDRDFGFFWGLALQGSLGEVAQQLLARLGLLHQLGRQELLQMVADSFGVCIGHDAWMASPKAE